MNMSIRQILPAIAVAIFNSRGEILLQRRKDTGNWCVPSGHVEFGETVEDAVLREIWEETGRRATIKRFIGIYSSPASQLYQYPNRSVHYITSYFEAALIGEIEENFQNEETLQLCYFKRNGLPKNIGPMHPQWLEHAIEKRKEPFIC